MHPDYILAGIVLLAAVSGLIAIVRWDARKQAEAREGEDDFLDRQI